MNVKSHRSYNSKFQLNVLSLWQIENATEEDKAWGIDKWARLFKTRSWEEIKMIGVTDEEILEVSRIMQKMNANETVRWEYERREDAIRHERLLNDTIAKQAEEIKKLQSEIEKLKSQIKEEKETFLLSKRQTKKEKRLITTVSNPRIECDSGINYE